MPTSALHIARKELREILRDRRSLVVLFLLPILLYPLLLIGASMATTAQLRRLAGRTFQVWVEDLPRLPRALRQLMLQTPLTSTLAAGGAAGNPNCWKKFGHHARNHPEISSGRSRPVSRNRYCCVCRSCS